ncbi:MAG: type II toxin-antitoxin system VapC family toxin [Acidobacteriota bacterium]
MVLVDTSIWVQHLRNGEDRLSQLLEAGQVVCHPLIIGELACGNLKNRAEILTLLHALPQATMVENEEALYFIDSHQLMGTGIGIVDVHLFASAKLLTLRIWTSDKPFRDAAKRLELSHG